MVKRAESSRSFSSSNSLNGTTCRRNSISVRGSVCRMSVVVFMCLREPKKVVRKFRSEVRTSSVSDEQPRQCKHQSRNIAILPKTADLSFSYIYRSTSFWSNRKFTAAYFISISGKPSSMRLQDIGCRTASSPAFRGAALPPPIDGKARLLLICVGIGANPSIQIRIPYCVTVRLYIRVPIRLNISAMKAPTVMKGIATP